MSKEQIEEKHALSESVYMSGHGLDWKDSDDIAEQLYTEGYRKQREGEWKMRIYNEHCSCGKSRKVARYECSVCKRIADMQPYGLTYCPNCGAKMKGSSE